MSRIITTHTEAFKYHELSDEAKQAAYEKGYTADMPDFWTEYIYEDAARVGEILGINFKTRPVTLVGGGTRMEPCIWWSGFWSQGDGACFEGTYRYAKGLTKKIREYAPKDEVLHSIADRLQKVQKKYFYKLTASVKHSGHYYHEGCTEIELDLDNASYARVDGDDSEEVRECLRDFMRWIYRQLEAEYEYQTSMEAFEQACGANEYEFDEHGSII